MSLRRHPLLVGLGLLLLGAGIALALFIYYFDLNRYRSDLEQSLSSATGQPVRLGHAHFAFDRGINLQFDQVSVGSEDTSARIEADQLSLRLEILPLLQQQISFDRLLLVRPRLFLTRFAATEPLPESPHRQLLLQMQDIFRTTRVRTLLVNGGSIVVVEQNASPPRRWQVENLDLLLSNLTPGEPIDISAAATLVFSDNKTPLTLSGTITLPNSTNWHQTALHLQLTAKSCNVATWFDHQSSVRSSGTFDLRFDLAGTPASGLTLHADLTSRDWSLEWPRWHRHPVPVRHLQFNSQWSVLENEQQLRDITFDLDGLRLTGSAKFPKGLSLDGATLDLSLARTPLTRLLPLLPEQLAPQLTETLQQGLRSGTLSSLRLTLRGMDEPGADPLSVLKQGEFTLEDGVLELPRLGIASGLRLRGTWENGTLTLRDGHGTLPSGTVNFEGEARLAPGTPARLRFAADGLLDAAGAVLLLPLPEESHQVASGSATIALTASGTSDHLSLNLQADLSALGLSLFGETLKAAGDPGDLFAVAEVRAGIVDLGLARLTIPAGELHASGRIFLTPPHAFRYVLDLARLDLEQLTRHDELARLLRVSGEAALHLDLAGDMEGALQREGWIDIRNLGLHFSGVVADLHRAGGRIRIVEDRAIIENARGHLGSSVLTGSGSLKLDKGFRLDLDIRGESLLAADLVFPSDQKRLNDLTGHLVIDSHGILFDQIRTRIGNGTRATVDGQLLGFAHPHLELAITAEQADIGEIIALWQSPSEINPYKQAERAHTDEESPGLTLRIEGQIARGNLYGLPFSNGRCIVTLRDGMLRIHPARFDTGAGEFRGQAVLRELHTPAPLLTITGHVENADAFDVYNQMLGRKGMLKGRLGGDFAIEGRLGSDYLPTSRGGFSLQVDDGELRQFPVLSKVFSLLNVSQIFSLRLPDLTAEGMPFRQLRATVSMNQGTLRTEDLVVRSDAMNLALVGNYNLQNNQLDLILGVKPLATVDKIFSSIPLAGWVLTGRDKALITAQFRVQGSGDEPKVDAIPITSVSETVVGIFKRLFGLPAKVIGDLQDLVGGEK